jgi:pyridoxine kinase
LCPKANILTPNQFELEWLCGKKLETADQLVAAAQALANPSSSTVVVTGGVWLSDMPEDGIVTFAIEGSSVWSITTPKLRGSTSGAGDLFAALFVSSLMFPLIDQSPCETG